MEKLTLQQILTNLYSKNKKPAQLKIAFNSVCNMAFEEFMNKLPETKKKVNFHPAFNLFWNYLE